MSRIQAVGHTRGQRSASCVSRNALPSSRRRCADAAEDGLTACHRRQGGGRVLDAWRGRVRARRAATRASRGLADDRKTGRMRARGVLRANLLLSKGCAASRAGAGKTWIATDCHVLAGHQQYSAPLGTALVMARRMVEMAGRRTVRLRKQQTAAGGRYTATEPEELHAHCEPRSQPGCGGVWAIRRGLPGTVHCALCTVYCACSGGVTTATATGSRLRCRPAAALRLCCAAALWHETAWPLTLRLTRAGRDCPRGMPSCSLSVLGVGPRRQIRRRPVLFCWPSARTRPA